MRPIDADALKEAFYERGLGYQAIDELINEAPTIDAVPVVRRKYSKTPKTAPYMLSKPNVLKCGCSGASCTGRLVYPTDFCNYGKRRENNDT